MYTLQYLSESLKNMLCLNGYILNSPKLLRSLSCRGPEGDNLGWDYRSLHQTKMTDPEDRGLHFLRFVPVPEGITHGVNGLSLPLTPSFMAAEHFIQKSPSFYRLSFSDLLGCRKGAAWFTVLRERSLPNQAWGCPWCQEWGKYNGLIWRGTICKHIKQQVRRPHSSISSIRNKAVILIVIPCIWLLNPAFKEVLW